MQADGYANLTIKFSAISKQSPAIETISVSTIKQGMECVGRVDFWALDLWLEPCRSQLRFDKQSCGASWQMCSCLESFFWTPCRMLHALCVMQVSTNKQIYQHCPLLTLDILERYTVSLRLWCQRPANAEQMSDTEMAVWGTICAVRQDFCWLERSNGSFWLSNPK